MANISVAVEKQAKRLSLPLDAPLSKADAKKIQVALEDVGISATVGEIQKSREAVLKAALSHVDDAGTRSRNLRTGGTQQPANTARSTSQLDARTGTGGVFDAEASFKEGFRAEMAAAGMLQWRPAETSGISFGSPVRRWIPSEADLAKMEKRPLTDLLPNASADVSVYWPKKAAERGPGTTIIVEKKGIFGMEYSGISLRAPKPAETVTEKPDQTTRKNVQAVLKKAGIEDASVLARGGTVEVYLMTGFAAVRTALENAGFKPTTVDDPYTGHTASAHVDPETQLPVRLLKDEVGGGV